VYRGQIDYRDVVVSKPETQGRGDLEREEKFMAEKIMTEEANRFFVNGGSFIPMTKTHEPVFKNRMFAEVQI
jgi:adenine-specific DNA-methyltransferase